MSLWQILGITLAASSISIGILCVLARAIRLIDCCERELHNEPPSQITNRAGLKLPTQSPSRVSADVRSHVVGDDTYPASLLNSFHVSGGMR